MRRILATGALLVLVLSGCATEDKGSGVASAGTGNSTQPTTNAPVSDEERGRQFAQCMRDNGVDMPDPDPNGGGGMGQNLDRNNPAFQKAMGACRSFLPGGGDLSKLDPKMIDQLRAFTQCMRDNGVNVPDPDPNSPTLGLDQMANLDRNSPAVQKAIEACQDKVPGRPGQ